MTRVRKINVSQVEGNNNGVLPAGTIVAYDNGGNGYTLRVHNGITAGGVPFNGSNGIVNRTVNFPNGAVGDTAGTLANDDGQLYFSTADYINLNQYINTPYSLATSEGFSLGQTDGTINVATILRNVNAAVLFILENGGTTTASDWSITMLDEDFGGTQICTDVGFNTDGNIYFNWTHREEDPTVIAEGAEFTVTYTGTLTRPAIWERISGGNTRIEYFDEELDYTSSVELTGNFRVDVDDAHLEVDGDGFWSLGSNNYDTKIFSTDNTAPIPLDVVIRANDRDWQFDSEGNLTLPTGGDILDSNGNSVLGGTAVDQNVWVQTFESDSGAPDDVVDAALSVEYDSDGNLICLFHHTLDYNPPEGDNGTYFSVAKISTTGSIIWRSRFGAGFYTDGWGLAVDNDAGFIYIAGRNDATDGDYAPRAMLTKIASGDGDLVWSKIYDFDGLESQSPVVDVASDGNPVMVSYAQGGSAQSIATTKVNALDGSVVWSRKFNGQGYAYAYGMGVGPSGEVVTVGYIDQYTEVLDSYSVTPQTGSGMEVLVINRSDLSNDTFTTNWKVAGTGIEGYASVTFINSYSGLTGTVQQGSGAVFDIVGFDSDYSITPTTAGTNYLVGHKILIAGTSIGQSDTRWDLVLTVSTVDGSGGITAATYELLNPGFYATGSWTGVSGTNYQTGSGLEFGLSLDDGSTYTEPPFNITAGGTNYVIGDVVVIPGTQLGGTTPANDLTATVSVDNGVVTGFNTFSGTQQTTTYRIIVAESEVDFSGTGSWTLNNIDVDENDRMLVVKYNSSGAIQWQKAVQFDEGYQCLGADCDIDSEGNIYVTGQYDETEGERVSLSIVKFNSSGVAQWSRRVAGNCETFGSSIVVGADDNLYLSGITAIASDDPFNGPPYSDTHSVLAKYSTDGAVLWQRLLENSSSWSFTGGFFETGGSNLAVKDGYMAVSGGYGDFENGLISASVAQVSAEGTVFSVGDWDFVAANFSGTLFDDASDLTVVDADKTDSDFSGDITVTEGSGGSDSSEFLIGTLYRAGSSNNELTTITGSQVGEILTIAQDANNATPGLEDASSIDYIPTSLLNDNDWIGSGANDSNTYATVTFANGDTRLIDGWNTDNFGDSGFLSLDTAITLTGEQAWPMVITSYNYNAGTTPGKGISVEGNVWKFDNVGDLTLPDGGTISEGIVTSNPTIQLTPANPDVASQKLVIKGGGGQYYITENGIDLGTNNNVWAVSDSATFYVYAPTRPNETLYWWIVPEESGISTTMSGTVELGSEGGGVFNFTVISDAYEFRVRVSPEENNYDPESIGVESVLINGDAPTFGADYHLHLTTGNLAETSIFLGTDDHNVRTTTDGKIQITTPSQVNKVWEFGTDGDLTIPGNIIAGSGTAQVGSILTIATNNTGGLGGYDVDALSVAYNADILSTFAGGTITFADNSTALIIGVNDQTTYIDIFIDTFQDPFDSIFPITLTTANYVAGDLDPVNIVVGDSTWAFGQNGGVTFPDATVQTTAYPGITTTSRPTTTGIPNNFTLSTDNNTNLTPGNYPNILVGFDGKNITLGVQVSNDYNITIYGITNASPATFVIGDNAVIGGDVIGGTTPADDLTITVDSLETVAIDLTKTINKLTDGTYALEDGVEGQIMYLVRSPETISENVLVNIENADGPSPLSPFRTYSGFTNIDNTGICTLIFTDGSWKQTGGLWD